MRLKAALLLFCLVALDGFASAQATRHFTFHYGFTVKDVAVGQKIRIW